MDTIFALATPQGKSGVAILRVSGDDAYSIAAYLGVNTTLTPRYAHYATLCHPDDGHVIDHALLLYFKAPHSFTGEDILEIHCHGGKAILHELTQTLLAHPALRYAEAGEFSKRALFNDKMDFIQAEALLDLIDAETSQQKHLAMHQFDGNISNHYEALEHSLIDTRAFCEVFIDFPDDDLPDNMLAQINKKITATTEIITEMLATSRQGTAMREGIQVAILGIPNAGKSTLINQLAARDVAMTSDIEGTTRDVIEVYRDINGSPFRFFDTAGIRDNSHDPLERQGIKLAQKKAKDAHIVLCVLDATKDMNEQYSILSPNVSRETIVIINKIDLVSEPEISDLSCDGNVSHETIHISAKERHGIDTLISKLSSYAYETDIESIYTTRARHIEHLQNGLMQLQKATSETDLVLKAEYLNHACHQIGHILGKIDLEDILDALFSSFCIGK